MSCYDVDAGDDICEACELACCYHLLLLPLYRLVCCGDVLLIDEDDNEDDQSGHTRVGTNSMYVPLTKSGQGLYDGGVIDTDAAVVVELTELPIDSDGSSSSIDAGFDPEVEFYKNFGGELAQRRAYYGRTTPLSFVSLEDHELLAAHFHPPDRTDNRAGVDAEALYRRPSDGGPSISLQIHRVLARYPSAVALESDLDTKRRMIKDYEQYKACFDAENVEDQEKAWIALQLARESRTSPMERITQYHLAIIHTNNLTEKAALRTEYRRFCFFVTEKQKPATASGDAATTPDNKTGELI